MAKHIMLDVYTERIKKYNHEISKYYIDIGRNLFEIQSMNMLEGSDYKNIKKYALDEFGFESSKTYNLINVFNRFFKPDHHGSISKKYYAYNFSQLVVMLNMSDDDIKLCQPEMTVKQIKEVKIKKSTRMDSVELANTAKSEKQLPGQNIIEGLFPEKEKFPEEKTTTIIVTELPREEKKVNKTITIDVKSENSVEDVNSNIDMNILYKKYYDEALEEIESLKRELSVEIFRLLRIIGS